MPKYLIEDKTTGKSIKIEANRKPTPEEATNLFKENTEQATEQATEQDETIAEQTIQANQSFQDMASFGMSSLARNVVKSMENVSPKKIKNAYNYANEAVKDIYTGKQKERIKTVKDATSLVSEAAKWIGDKEYNTVKKIFDKNITNEDALNAMTGGLYAKGDTTYKKVRNNMDKIYKEMDEPSAKEFKTQTSTFVNMFVDEVADLPVDAGINILRQIKGWEGVGNSKFSKLLDKLRKYKDDPKKQKAQLKKIKKKLKGDEIFGMMTPEELSNLSENLGYSIATRGVGMAGGLLAAAGVTALTKSSVAGKVAGQVAGGAGAFAGAYRAAMYEFGQGTLKSVDALMKQQRGKGLTEEEIVKLKKVMKPYAKKFGLGEAIPETAGGLLGFNVFANAFKATGLGPTVAKTAAAYAYTGLSEVTQEGVTEKYQNGILYEFEQDMGLPEGLLGGVEPKWFSVKQWAENIKDVAPLTVLQTLTLGGGTAITTQTWHKFKQATGIEQKQFLKTLETQRDSLKEGSDLRKRYDKVLDNFQADNTKIKFDKKRDTYMVEKQKETVEEFSEQGYELERSRQVYDSLIKKLELSELIGNLVTEKKVKQAEEGTLQFKKGEKVAIVGNLVPGQKASISGNIQSIIDTLRENNIPVDLKDIKLQKGKEIGGEVKYGLIKKDGGWVTKPIDTFLSEDNNYYISGKSLINQVKQGLSKLDKNTRGMINDFFQKGEAKGRKITEKEARKIAKRNIRKMSGRQYVNMTQVTNSLYMSMRHFWGKNKEEKLNFLDKVETGNLKGLSQGERRMAEMFKTILDYSYKLDRITKGDVSYIEDYMPHLFERPDKIKGFFTGKLAQTSPHMKKRIIPTIKDAMKKGYELRTDNPAELILHRVLSSVRMSGTKRIIAKLEKEGLLRRVNNYNEVNANNWKPVDTRKLNRFIPTGKGSFLEQKAVVASGAESILNNWLDPGMYGYSATDSKSKVFLKKAGKTFVGIKNMLLVPKLLGIFHPAEVTISEGADQFVSFARYLEKGKFKDASEQLLKAATLPFKSIGGGRVNKLRENIKNGNMEDTDVQNAISGNIRTRIGKEYMIGTIDKFQKAMKRHEWGKAGLYSIPMVLEEISAPLMRHFIPNLKVNVYLEAAERIRKLHPEFTQTQLDTALQQKWDEVDNHFGQLTYDNLFWNQMLQDTMKMMALSMGWTFGSARTIGGTARDTAKWATGKGGITDKMLYSAFYFSTVGLLGGLTHWAFTGRRPKEVKDFILPATGRDVDGNDIRNILPSIAKEFTAITRALEKKGLAGGLWEYLMYKRAPVFGEIQSIVSNKDFYNIELNNPHDPMTKRVLDTGKWFLSQQKPFFWSSKKRLEKRGLEGFKTWLPLLGIIPRSTTWGFKPTERGIYDTYFMRRGSGGTDPKTQRKINKVKDRLVTQHKKDWDKYGAVSPKTRKRTRKELAKFLKKDKEILEKDRIMLYKLIEQVSKEGERGDYESSEYMFRALPDEDQLEILKKIPLNSVINPHRGLKIHKWRFYWRVASPIAREKYRRWRKENK